MRRLAFAALAALTMAMLVPGSPARAAAASPTLSIDTPGPYLDRQAVRVTGSGLRPGAVLRVAECESHGICNWWFGPTGTVPADGTLAFDVELTRYFDGYDPTEGEPPVDCAHYGCLLGLVEENAPDIFDEYAVRASVPLPFADVPPVLPDVHVTPTDDLPAIATVDVRASGFTPTKDVAVEFCTRTPRGCSSAVASPTADAGGRIATTVTVHRLGAYWDCVETPTCALVFHGFRPGDNVTVPLRFDPDAPTNRPSMSLDRDHDLALRDTVQVRGDGLPPSTEVRVEQCSDVLVTGRGTCPSSVVTRTDTTGALTVALPVRRYVDFQFIDPVDCADAGVCFVRVSGGLTLPPTQAPIRFARDTADAAVTLGSTQIVEGTGTAFATATVPITLDHPAPTSVWVDWTAGFTSQNTATTSVDFLFTTGTAWVPAGTTSASIRVPIAGDAIDEPTESFIVVASRVDGARFATDGNRGSVTILDDDRRPQVNIADALVVEAAGHATIPVRLSAISSRAVTITNLTHHRSARSGDDFVRSKGTVRIEPGGHITHIRIPIVDDHRRERGEEFTVELSDAHNAVAGNSLGTVWIGDDD